MSSHWIAQKTKHDRSLDDAQATMSRIGLKMIDDRKKAILAGNAIGETKIGYSSVNVHGEDFDMKGKDLLTLLVKGYYPPDLSIITSASTNLNSFEVSL